MTKWHYNPFTGTPGRCEVDSSNPKSRGCLYGKDMPHFKSRGEAAMAYEKIPKREDYIKSISRKTVAEGGRVSRQQQRLLDAEREALEEAAMLMRKKRRARKSGGLRGVFKRKPQLDHHWHKGTKKDPSPVKCFGCQEKPARLR